MKLKEKELSFVWLICYFCTKTKRTGQGLKKWWVQARAIYHCILTFWWRGSLSYKNQSVDLICKSMEWFLHDRDLGHKRVKRVSTQSPVLNKVILKINYDYNMLIVSVQQGGIRFLSAWWNNFQWDKTSIIFSHNTHTCFQETKCMSWVIKVFVVKGV